MSYIKDVDDIKNMCRICLIQRDNMIPMESKLEVESDQLIVDALENILSIKVNGDSSYPREICQICYGNLRISFALKIIFNKSQNILDKYISSLNSAFSEESDNDLLQDNNRKMRKISVSDSCEDNSFSTKGEVEDLTEIGDNFEEEHLHLEAPVIKKIVKLKIGSHENNNVKVKWVEGNKFIIEKNENMTPKIIHKCSYCNKRFLSNEKFTEHLTVCKKFVIVRCEFCNNKFSSLARKRYHIKLRHNTNAPAVKCEICNEVFKNYNAKSYHKITRHSTEGKKYRCELCGKAFYIKNSLNQHMECHTRDVSRVVCPICGKSFHYRGGLFYHMKMHRNERNYICNFCGRRFLTLAALKRHTRIHTGERPYSCSFCSKTFCSVSEVKTHERRHTGQKPYHCNYCKKSFISPYNLKLHKSSHSGSHPCGFCEKSFLNTEVLKYHFEIKHNLKQENNEEIE